MQEVLRYLDKESLALLRPKLQLARFEAGKIILAQGRPSPALFIIRSGDVGIVRNHDGPPMHVADLYVGQLFGESAFLEALPASAAVRANSDVDLIVMSPGKLQPLFAEHPRLFSQFYRSLAYELSRKLRRATGEVGGSNSFIDRYGEIPAWEIL